MIAQEIPAMVENVVDLNAMGNLIKEREALIAKEALKYERDRDVSLLIAAMTDACEGLAELGLMVEPYLKSQNLTIEKWINTHFIILWLIGRLKIATYSPDFTQPRLQMMMDHSAGL